MNTLVGRQAPDFAASAVLANGQIVDNFQLSTAIKNKYAILFFYPLNFTFVCPSELIALDRRIDQFKAKNVEVIGISIDSHFSHNAWRNTPVQAGGIGPINYSLVADISQEICKSYGIQHANGVAFRAAFLIDQAGIVRAQMVNDLPLGRNIDELLRLVDALQFHEEHGEVCPAGWQKGEKGMHASPEGVALYLEAHAESL